jgi:translation initiation factor 2B subunit (eIF-2B alpha/beta/delta family)
MLIQDSKDVKMSVINPAKAVIGNPKSVFTYSYSSTVVELIKSLGKPQVIVTESRPLYEGRTLAEELTSNGIKVLLIIDAAIGMYIKKSQVAIIGADSVTHDGSAINKMGSKLLALAAKEQGIPFYVVCDTMKFAIMNYLGKSIELEEKEPEEVAKIKGVMVRNPYFEVIQSHLITGIITEEGLMKPFDIRRKMKGMQKEVELLFK